MPNSFNGSSNANWSSSARISSVSKTMSVWISSASSRAAVSFPQRTVVRCSEVEVKSSWTSIVIWFPKLFVNTFDSSPKMKPLNSGNYMNKKEKENYTFSDKTIIVIRTLFPISFNSISSLSASHRVLRLLEQERPPAFWNLEHIAGSSPSALSLQPLTRKAPPDSAMLVQFWPIFRWLEAKPGQGLWRPFPRRSPPAV